MPRNRRTRNRSPLATFPLLGPGFKGLNTELANASGFADSTWASVLENAVFDDLGRLTLRKGYTVSTTTPITSTPTVEKVHEFLQNDGTTSIVVVTSDFKIYESTDNGATFSDISGDFTTNSLATALVKFANFDGELYATAPGFKIYRYTGAGTFTEQGDSQATNGTLLAAFGRLWAGRDAASIIDYCALSDGTDWSGTSAGSVEVTNAWTNGIDTIEALSAFGSTLVVFGKEHILMYVDGAGSVLGVDPDNLYVVDTVEGTGTEHQDSVIPIGEGDLWFMGPNGVQSLARVIQDKVNPLVDISKNVRTLVQDNISNHVGSSTTIQAIHSPEERFALFLFPETSRILCFDTRFQLEDGTYRASTWESLDYNAMGIRRNGDIIFGLAGGEVAKYAEYRDDSGAADTIYNLTYASPWINLGPEVHANLKILKSFYAFFYGRETLSGTARWSFDYRPLEYSVTFTNDYTASGAEWGSGEWGSGEFGDGLRVRKQEFAGQGQGQVIKLYITFQSLDVDEKIALQEIGLRAKVGRRT